MLSRDLENRRDFWKGLISSFYCSASNERHTFELTAASDAPYSQLLLPLCFVPGRCFVVTRAGRIHRASHGAFSPLFKLCASVSLQEGKRSRSGAAVVCVQVSFTFSAHTNGRGCNDQQRSGDRDRWRGGAGASELWLCSWQPRSREVDTRGRTRCEGRRVCRGRCLVTQFAVTPHRDRIGPFFSCQFESQLLCLFSAPSFSQQSQVLHMTTPRERNRRLQLVPPFPADLNILSALHARSDRSSGGQKGKARKTEGERG